MAAADEDHVDFNLDTLENEKPGKEFSFVLEGRKIVLQDPQNLDVFELASLRADDPAGFFRACCSDEDFAFIAEKSMPGWKFGKLIERFQKHTGIVPPGKLGASRTS
jgi:hypothetical protein